MDQTMTPSGMTDNQIEKILDQHRAMLRKHRAELASKEVQQVLGQPEYVAELTLVLRRRVEAVSNLIIRHVAVYRDRSPQVVLDVTHRKQYVDKSVLDAMPRGNGTEAEVIFFKVGRSLSDADLKKEYELRGLIPADPYSQAAVNEGDPAFADDHPNGTHWQDADGNWCCAIFHRWGDERFVNVRRGDRGWDDRWWFAGLRKDVA